MRSRRYHIELITLFGEACLGDNPASKMQVREILPLGELLQNLLPDETRTALPAALRSAYLAVLQNAYLSTVHAIKDIGDSDEFPLLIIDLIAQVVAFVEVSTHAPANHAAPRRVMLRRVSLPSITH